MNIRLVLTPYDIIGFVILGLLAIMFIAFVIVNFIAILSKKWRKKYDQK